MKFGDRDDVTVEMLLLVDGLRLTLKWPESTEGDLKVDMTTQDLLDMIQAKIGGSKAVLVRLEDLEVHMRGLMQRIDDLEAQVEGTQERMEELHNRASDNICTLETALTNLEYQMESNLTQARADLESRIDSVQRGH